MPSPFLRQSSAIPFLDSPFHDRHDELNVLIKRPLFLYTELLPSDSTKHIMGLFLKYLFNDVGRDVRTHGFGLRHTVDPDPNAVIDSSTRKLIQAGDQLLLAWLSHPG